MMLNELVFAIVAVSNGLDVFAAIFLFVRRAFPTPSRGTIRCGPQNQRSVRYRTVTKMSLAIYLSVYVPSRQ